MLTKLQIVFFISLTTLFCVKEFALIKFSDTCSYCSVADICEDETQSSPETSFDDTDDSELMLNENYNLQFNYNLFFCVFHKSYSHPVYNEPYSEIHLPPPELS